MHGKKLAATRNLQASSVIGPDMQKLDSFLTMLTGCLML